MSYLSSEYIQCETIQSMLNEKFLTCTNLDPMPTLEAILASQLSNGISQSVSDGSGKVKSVKVVYEQRLLESSVTEGSGARACTTENETFDNYTVYEIDPNVWMNASESFKVADLATVCTHDVQSMLANKINKVIDVIERKIATKTAQELVGLSGNWASDVSVNGSNEFVVATLTSAATKVLNPMFWTSLQIALNKTGYCNAPVVTGGTAFYEGALAHFAGCCSTTGADIAQLTSQYGKAVFYDRRVSAALGSDAKSIVMQPGSVALIYYNEAGQVPNLGANYAKFRVNSPRTGLPIDIVVKDDCGTIQINGYANTKLVSLPNDMFAVGDVYEGVNFVNKLLVTNPA